MSLKLLCDAYEAMQRARTADELRVQMARFAREMGFEHFTYALTIEMPSMKPQQYFINGFPQAWLERYLSQGYFKVDPIVRHAETSTLPAIWSEDVFHDGKSAQFWDEARNF